MLGLIILSMVGCNNSKQEVEQKINQLYSKQEGIYSKPLDNSLFSNELAKKIKNVQDLIKTDEERIKNSSSPTDKPIMFEGNAFTSLTEGFTKYTIKEILIKDNKAEAIVEFQYNYSTPKEIWTDKVNLVNENGWKIDNIRFSVKIAGYKDLKERLTSVKTY